MKQLCRQTGIAKNLDTFWQKHFFWIFFVHQFVYMQKEFWFYLHWFSHNYSSKLLINLKEKQKNGDNSGKKQFFKKRIFGISSDGHSDPKYVVVTIVWSKLWRAVPEQTDRLTDWRTDIKVKTEGPKIMFIESRLQLTLDHWRSNYITSAKTFSQQLVKRSSPGWLTYLEEEERILTRFLLSFCHWPDLLDFIRSRI